MKTINYNAASAGKGKSSKTRENVLSSDDRYIIANINKYLADEWCQNTTHSIHSGNWGVLIL